MPLTLKPVDYAGLITKDITALHAAMAPSPERDHIEMVLRTAQVEWLDRRVSSSMFTPVVFTYRNYKGEVAIRHAAPRQIWYGSTAHHPELGWFMTALDTDRNVTRDFALKDVVAWGDQARE